MVAAAGAAADPTAGGWIPLFNGRDLDGWTVKIAGHDLGDNFGDTFRVEDGLLKVAYDHYDRFQGRFGHLFYRTPYSHYRLRAEYRFRGRQLRGGPSWAERNSGIMIHGQSPGSMPKDQQFPVSVEVQLLGGTGRGPRPTANVCTPGTAVMVDGRRVTQCAGSQSATFEGNRWVWVEIEVRGSEAVTHSVNGEPVLTYRDLQLDGDDPDGRRLLDAGASLALGRGTISLQSESHPVEFRRVELLPLGE
jgi:hypothetical protein